MNRTHIYNEFIQDRLRKEPKIYKGKDFNARHRIGSRVNSQYWEVHHITPVCIGGGSHPNNLINLSYEDHIAAHSLLLHIYIETKYASTLAYALLCMIPIGKTLRFRTILVNKRLKRAMKTLKEKHLSMSEETKKKISEGNKGKQFSPEHRLKISKSRRGMRLSETHKQNISKGIRGEKCYWSGRIGGQAQGAKMVKNLNTGEVFPSLTDAALSLGGNRQNIQSAIERSEQKTAYECEWSYCNKSGTLIKNKSPYAFRDGLSPSAKPVVCVEKEVVYTSARKAAARFGKGPQGITAQLKGRQKSAIGFHWKYATNEEISKLKRILQTHLHQTYFSLVDLY